MNSPTEQARERLQARRGQYRRICELGDLDYSWLSKFANGVIVDPGVNRLFRLQQALDALDSLPVETPDFSNGSQDIARGSV
jgi:transcriptional regulator with XRE-family HTH domain